MSQCVTDSNVNYGDTVRLVDASAGVNAVFRFVANPAWTDVQNFDVEVCILSQMVCGLPSQTGYRVEASADEQSGSASACKNKVTTTGSDIEIYVGVVENDLLVQFK